MSGFSLQDANEAYIDSVEAYLEDVMADRLIYEPLTSAMRYSLFAGGKRLRPCLLIAAWELFGGDFCDVNRQRTVMPLAAAIEMIHTYSLIHDDLPCMDDDDFRRGKLTNHKVFGEAMAVLAGDGLLSQAFELMITALNANIKKIPTYGSAVEAIIKGAGCLGMVSGQAADIINENNNEAGYDELRYIHKNKTGALIKAAMLAGAYAVGNYPTEHQLNALTEFSEQYGILFQITDDILDVCGKEADLGKSVGKDADSNKLTYPKLFGIEESRRLAKETADKAIEAISAFGESAEYFTALIEYTLSRRN